MKLLEKLNNEQLELLETFFYPPALAECLFSNLGQPNEFKEDKLGDLRLYQVPMISFEDLYDIENYKGTAQEKFDLRKGASECFCLGGRGTGKSGIFQIIDLNLRLVYSLFNGGYEIGFSAYVWDRIKKILDKVKQTVDNHPFLKLLKCNVKTQAPYEITSQVTGLNIFGINMNVKGRNCGENFYGLHLPVLFIEEKSFENDKVSYARKHSISELGCIERSSGMMNFTKMSPAGKIYYNPENKNRLLSLPQKVNPNYTEKQDKENVEEFGGIGSPGYKMFVDALLSEEGCTIFDFSRIEIDDEKYILSLEVGKDNFVAYQGVLDIMERPKNASRLFLCADVGFSGGTEIILVSEIKDTDSSHAKYRYLANITLFELYTDEQKAIFKYIGDKLNIDIFAIDTGEGDGRNIANYLEKEYSPANVVQYDGNRRIAVDTQKDENGDDLIIDGEVVYKEEHHAEWSIKNLQRLFYNSRMYLPYDAKFYKQFSNVISKQLANRVHYECVSKKDHLMDAFRVFSIAQWLCEFKDIKPTKKKAIHIGF